MANAVDAAADTPPVSAAAHLHAFAHTALRFGFVLNKGDLKAAEIVTPTTLTLYEDWIGTTKVRGASLCSLMACGVFVSRRESGSEHFVSPPGPLLWFLCAQNAIVSYVELAEEKARARYLPSCVIAYVLTTRSFPSWSFRRRRMERLSGHHMISEGSASTSVRSMAKRRFFKK